MLRRFYPAFLVLICFILDTTVMPVVYGGVYAVPISIVVVFGIGIALGRMRGLLYGTLAGLLMDITTGTLGMMTFFFMYIGFMIGLIVYEPGERVRISRRQRRRRVVWCATWVFALYATGELALLMVQYFNTAVLEFIYFVNIVVRALICTALVMLLRPAMKRGLAGRGAAKAIPRNREVKNF